MKLVVRPADDGHDMDQNWEVTGRGKTTSHTRKQAAVNEANRRAHVGDEKEIRGTNGQILRTSTHQGSRDDDRDERMGFRGVPSSPRKYGEEAKRIGVEDFFK